MTLVYARVCVSGPDLDLVINAVVLLSSKNGPLCSCCAVLNTGMGILRIFPHLRIFFQCLPSSAFLRISAVSSFPHFNQREREKWGTAQVAGFFFFEICPHPCKQILFTDVTFSCFPQPFPLVSDAVIHAS